MKQIINAITFKPIEYFLLSIAIVVPVALLATPYYKFAAVPGLLVFILFVLSRYPKVGFYIILFLIPFDAYTGIMGGASVVLSIPRFVGIWVLLVLLLSFLLNKKNTFNIESDLWRWLILFFVISIISALLSEFKKTSFDNLKVLFIAYTFFAMTLIFVSRKDFSKTLPVVIICSVSISSFLGIADYVFDLGLFSNPEEVERKVGAAEDPNEFSAMIIFSLPLLANWFFTSEKKSTKLMMACLFALNVIAIILTYSRGGGLILAIALGLLFLEHIKRFKAKHLGILIAMFGVVVIIIIVFMPATYWERLKSLAKPSIVEEDRSIGGRATFLKAGLEAFKEKPFLGFGPGCFREYFANTEYAIKYSIEGGRQKSRKRAAHNSYIEFLVGQGLIGFIVYLAIIFIVLKKFAVAKKQFLSNGNNEMASLTNAFRIAYITMLFSMVLLSYNYHKYFWAALALSHVAFRLSSQKQEEELEENTNARIINA